MLKKFPLDKIDVIKNVLFFLSRAPTHHSFTFNTQFLIRRFVFINVYIFVQQKAWTL